MLKHSTTVCILSLLPCLAMACAVTEDCPFDALSAKHVHQELTQRATINDMGVHRNLDVLSGPQAFDSLDKHNTQTKALERSDFLPISAKPKVETWSPQRHFDMLTNTRVMDGLTETHDHHALSMRRSTVDDWKPSGGEPLARGQRDEPLARCN